MSAAGRARIRRRRLAAAALAILLLPAGLPGALALELQLSRTLSERQPAAKRFPGPTQPLIAALTINAVRHGEKFVHATASGALLVRAEDLRGIVTLPAGVEEYDVEGERHVLLSSIPGARVEFDEKTLEAKVMFAPELLPGRVIDLARRPPEFDAIASPRSALLNYRLGYYDATGSGSGFLSLATEAAISAGGWLLRSQSTHSRSQEGTTGARLETQLIRDDRENLRRLILGDSFTPGLPLGSAVPFGGVTFAKAYLLDPYVTRQPGAGFRGVAEFPSQVDFYVGNTLVMRQRVDPGPYEIRNFNYYGGRQDVRVVVRDVFGREQTVAYPFYFAPQGLAAGLHDYAYQAGVLREDFGSRSTGYAEPVLAMFHRYGVNDRLTLGVRAEGTSKQFNAGPEAVFRDERVGVFAAGASVNRDEDADGHAFYFSHAFQLRELSTQILYQRHSAGYAPLHLGIRPALPRSDAGAVVGYSSPGLGSLNVGFARREMADEPLSRYVTLAYSLPVGGAGNLIATWRRELGPAGGNEFFAGLQLLLDGTHVLNASHARDLHGATTDTVQLSRELPRGEGIAYSLNAQRREDETGSRRTVNPRLEWHTRWGTLSGEAAQVSGGGAATSTAYNVALAGALVAAGGHFATSRPITDSFAVVELSPPLAGVRVYENSQEIGRTDARGRVLLPNIASYSSNYASINDKDIPIEYAIDRLGWTFSPGYRTGALLSFQVRRVQGFAGRLRLRLAGEERPLEYHLVTLAAGGSAFEFTTAGGGDFYVENVPAGRHRARVAIEGKPCEFELVFPESTEMLVPLGDVFTCALAH